MRLETSYKKKSGFRRILFATITLLAFISLGNFEISGQTETVPPELEAEDYRIGPGDVIDVIVSKNPTLSRMGIRVSNEGLIQLPILETDIPAACSTEKELSVFIAEKYKKYLINPNVIVAVKEFHSAPVSVIGSVLAPTRFQLQRPMRLMDALLQSSGPNDKAGPTVQIIRNYSFNRCQLNVTATPDTTNEKIMTFAIKKTLDGDEQSNPYVQAGDVIRVVEAEVAKIGQVYVIGNVKLARAIDLKEPVTLTQAIAMAGGASDGAQLDKVKISRQIVGSLSKNEILVNLKEVNKRNEGDIELKPNDIIEVPGPSGSKKFLRDIFRSIIPLGSRLPVLVP